nr:unnamed protein product [Callosobruchus chinensis]
MISLICLKQYVMEKDLHFIEEQKEKVASWKHVMTLYENDRKRGAFSQFIKLTDEHVIPSKINKMKVKNCSQVFSHTATSMHLAAKDSADLPQTSEFYLDPQASDTADGLLFFDKLFDSVNGSLLTPPQVKN